MIAEAIDQLAERIEGGDPAAEAQLVERHRRGLKYLLRRLVRDPALAEDLAQETLRIVLEKVRGGELREADKLAAFVRGTARNLAFAEHRKRSRRGVHEALADVPEPPAPEPGALDRVLDREDRQWIRRLLDELPSPRDRQVLLRFHLAEESKEVICRDLGLGSQQFNLVLFRARKRFRNLVEKSLQGRREDSS
jgi:RNA polymerase sigma-70 factor (ECF subfamily)